MTEKEQRFTDIMRCYRSQPHASSHVYRSVLLCTKARRESASSCSVASAGGNNVSTTPSPAPSEPKDDDQQQQQQQQQKTAEQAPPVRSSSTLPLPQPSSCPPTPTGLAGTASSFEYEDRGDLILFYNTVYARRLQKFALKFSNKNRLVSSSLGQLFNVFLINFNMFIFYIFFFI